MEPTSPPEGYTELKKLGYGKYTVDISKQPGSYLIQAGERFYVGSAADLRLRITSHLSELKRGVNCNRNLQAVYNENNQLSIFVKPADDRDTAFQEEQSLLDTYRESGRLLNIATTDARGNVGVTRAPETIEKFRASHVGFHHSEETKNKMSQSHLGKTLSAETRQKMSEAKKGKGGQPIPVTIGEKSYPSIKDAALDLGIPQSTLYYKLFSRSKKGQ